jgi:oligoendopeptidase F
MSALTIPQRPARKFLGEEFSLTTWEQLQPFYENLKNRVINSTADLRQWFLDKSELESYLSENFAWRYIRMTCDTASELYQQEFNDFLENFQPQLSAYGNELDKKALESPFLGELKDSGFDIALRSMKKAIEIFREENIPLQTQIQGEQAKYGATVGAMMVSIEGEEVTLQKASDYLQSTDRPLREEVWHKIQTRRLEDKDALDQLLNNLRDLRHQVATNAGFGNFRDYMFAALGRFDYTPQDCFSFHESVAEAVVPMLNDMATERKQALQLEVLRPWDFKVDPQNRPPLKPFSTGEELLEKTITCFTLLDPQLGDYLRVMKAMGHLDLESRKGKAPGGYNYPLEEIGVPFIFMNATSNLRDLVTLLHEGGHAVHNFVTRDLLLNSFKNPPAEVAELASMSMELLTMDYWNVFFEDAEDLRRAKIQHLESIIETLPWVATIDKFQHWLYENPTHSIEERQNNWLRIYEQFSDAVTDWSGFDDFKKYIWQKQLHIYEVPFYYIEYGMAQLGAVGVWRNYKQNPKQGLAGYLNALKLGYTAPISEIYAAANIPFDFSKGYITELMNFVKNELEELKK